MPKAPQLLLPFYKKFDYTDNEKRTPLHITILLNRLSYVEILLRSGADISVNK